MYLPEKSVETIASFTTALRLLDSSSSRQVRAQSGGEEHPNPVVFSPVFLVTPAVLENNLLTAYRSLGYHHDCLDWLSQRTGIPAALVGGAYIIVFSLVDWSDDKLDPMSRLESLLRTNGAFAVDQSRSLWTEVKRMQSESNHLITAANECLNGMSKQLSLSSGKSFLDGILKDLMVMLSYSDSSSDEGLGYYNSTVNASLGIALMLQYYVPIPNDPSKSRDINQALVRNLHHRAVSDVYLLNEREFDFSEFPHNDKIHQFVIGRRLTFKTAFSFANRYLVGRTVILGK